MLERVGANTCHPQVNSSLTYLSTTVSRQYLDLQYPSTDPNIASISPDGRTLLSVGDSPDVYLHRITGGAHVRFSQITKLSLSPYLNSFLSYSYGSYGSFQSNISVPASFSTAFSANGSKFAVGSQEGIVVVWDVRSTKPLKVVETDKNRTGTDRGRATGGATGYLYESPWPVRAPGWGVRSVKFSPRGVGREVLTFTEVSLSLWVELCYGVTDACFLAYFAVARNGRTNIRDRRNRAHTIPRKSLNHAPHYYSPKISHSTASSPIFFIV
jgi:hypothetical protein